MMRPQIGHDYRLDIKSDLYDEPIAWVNSSSRKLYDTWEEINGDIVKVKAETMIMSTYYIVTLLRYPKDTFYVPKKLLMELTRRLTISCQCVLQLLINHGCQCGAFKKEQASSK
jgi:hypothetical protein